MGVPTSSSSRSPGGGEPHREQQRLRRSARGGPRAAGTSGRRVAEGRMACRAPPRPARYSSKARAAEIAPARGATAPASCRMGLCRASGTSQAEPSSLPASLHHLRLRHEAELGRPAARRRRRPGRRSRRCTSFAGQPRSPEARACRAPPTRRHRMAPRPGSAIARWAKSPRRSASGPRLQPAAGAPQHQASPRVAEAAAGDRHARSASKPLWTLGVGGEEDVERRPLSRAAPAACPKDPEASRRRGDRSAP